MNSSIHLLAIVRQREDKGKHNIVFCSKVIPRHEEACSRTTHAGISKVQDVPQDCARDNPLHNRFFTNKLMNNENTRRRRRMTILRTNGLFSPTYLSVLVHWG